MPTKIAIGGPMRQPLRDRARVVGYVRVSTAGQEANGVGLNAQREAIEAECARRGWPLDRIEEDVLSGKNMKRPGLQRALADCRTGAVAGIVAAKIDRLSRSVIDFATLLEDARRRGYNVVVLDLGLDLSTPNGELIANTLANVAQWERRIIGQRTKEALAVVKARGPRPGKLPPGRPAVLAPELRTRLRRMRGRGLSYAAIAARLNEEAVATAHGGRQWYPATVRKITG